MKYKTLFRLGLRFFGIVLCVESLVRLGDMVSITAWSTVNNQLSNWTWRFSVPALTSSAIGLALGLYLFFGGKWIVNLAIPSNRPYCPECAYDLSGTTNNRCPECGTPFRPEDIAPPKPPSSP